MQSYIYTSGYGFRKQLCEDVATWFLNKFFPCHKIEVEIIHRGLKREGVLGYCDVAGKTYHPREFLIELDTYMCEEMYIKTLLHELTHLRQWVTGSLRMRRGKSKSNTTGYKNVYLTSSGKYNARGYKDYTYVNLGTYDTIEEANFIATKWRKKNHEGFAN